MSFLVLWSICLSFSVVDFKNGPEYLTRGGSRGIYPFYQVPAIVWFWVAFSFSWEILSKFLLSSPHFMVSAFNIPKYFLHFLFSEGSYFSWFGCSIPSVKYHFPLFIIIMEHFSRPHSILQSLLYILTACIWVSYSFSFLTNSLMSFMYIRWLIFSYDLQSLYPAVNFLSMWMSGTIKV